MINSYTGIDINVNILAIDRKQQQQQKKLASGPKLKLLRMLSKLETVWKK